MYWRQAAIVARDVLIVGRAMRSQRLVFGNGLDALGAKREFV
jgi:hypothetical protein